ncbi:DNA polymerase delta small subunit Cdc1 [Metarhizium acridum]|nr:DNA polymerase delta small subunit Cdc1 [Metarhizium acridum]
MGTENSSGEFEVIDTKYPDLPDQPERWALSKPPSSTNGHGKSRQIVKEEDQDVEMTDASQSTPQQKDRHREYLLGLALTSSDQEEVASISRLIIAGNSISTTAERKEEETLKKGNKKYGYDASSYNALPSQLFDEFADTLLPSIPITLLPGAQDPANASYPQQPNPHGHVSPRKGIRARANKAQRTRVV